MLNPDLLRRDPERTRAALARRDEDAVARVRCGRRGRRRVASADHPKSKPCAPSASGAASRSAASPSDADREALRELSQQLSALRSRAESRPRRSATQALRLGPEPARRQRAARQGRLRKRGPARLGRTASSWTSSRYRTGTWPSAWDPRSSGGGHAGGRALLRAQRRGRHAAAGADQLHARRARARPGLHRGAHAVRGARADHVRLGPAAQVLRQPVPRRRRRPVADPDVRGAAGQPVLRPDHSAGQPAAQDDGPVARVFARSARQPGATCAASSASSSSTR